MYMREGEKIPLYCVASNRTLLHTYRWESSSGELSVLSPVLWVNEIDTNKCTVTESANSREYHSSNICKVCYGWHSENRMLYNAILSYVCTCYPLVFLP